MPKQNGAPTAADKGKGKAVDSKSTDGKNKHEEPKKDKDGKLIMNGKVEEPEEGIGSKSYCLRITANRISVLIDELSEEDQNLKNELEMLVSRLHV